MKTTYVSELGLEQAERPFQLLAWVSSIRDHGSIVFLDLEDSSGLIQVACEPDTLRGTSAEALTDLTVDTAVEATLEYEGPAGHGEWRVSGLSIVAPSKPITPPLRGSAHVLRPKFTDQVLSSRHLYVRHPDVVKILKARHHLTKALRTGLEQNEFYEVAAPILTPVPLYKPETAIALEVHGQPVYLTQCVGFYLEALAHGLERVYNIGPSFRNEKGTSRRHLLEYWHVKAEAAFASRDDMMALAEQLIADAGSALLGVTGEAGPEAEQLLQELRLPFPRIGYSEAIDNLGRKGVDLEFGRSLGRKHEIAIGRDFNSPFWIVGNPKTTEPFPYRVDHHDERVTRTADLIAPRGFGELLGVAEKIATPDELEERLRESGHDIDQYAWVSELREHGCVPRSAFGMGLERLLRWLTGARHVRDCVPFPRLFGRRIHP